MSRATHATCGSCADVLERLIGIEQLARCLEVSAKTVRRMLADGKLPAAVMGPGKMRRWRLGEINGWIAAGCPNAMAWLNVRHEYYRPLAFSSMAGGEADAIRGQGIQAASG